MSGIQVTLLIAALVAILLLCLIPAGIAYFFIDRKQNWNNYTAAKARADQLKTNITAETVAKATKVIADRANAGRTECSFSTAFFEPISREVFAAELVALGYEVKIFGNYTVDVAWPAPAKKP